MRALGDAKTPLYAIVVAALMNVALDLLFVVGFHWGIAGAAIATVVSQVASAVYCFFNVRKITILQVLPGDLKALPGFDPHFAEAGLSHGLAERHHRHGQHGGAVLSSTATACCSGGLYRHQQALRPAGDCRHLLRLRGDLLRGQNLGARLVNRIKRGQRAAAVVAFLTSVVIAAAMLLFGRLVLGLFISGEPAEVEASLDIAYHYLSIMSVCLPILYMLHIYRSALMGLGDTVVPHALRLRGDGGAHWRGLAAALVMGQEASTMRRWAPGPPRPFCWWRLLRQDAGPLPAQGLCPGRKKLKGVLVWSRR